MRESLDHPRGSAKAAAYAVEKILGKPDILSELEKLVAIQVAPRIAEDSVLLRPAGLSDGEGNICLSSRTPGEGSRFLVRDVALFRLASTGEGQLANPYAWLAFTVTPDVWTGWEVGLVQGRNQPYAEWGSTCEAAEFRRPAPFAREFWQSVPQASPPTPQWLASLAANDRSNWGEDRRVFSIPEKWIGTEVPVATLLEKLVLEEHLRVGQHDQGKSPLLSQVSKQWIYRNRVTVTVYQEQFEGPANFPRDVRMPFATMQASSAEDARKTKHIWFPEEYATFSIDIRWFRETGSSPLVFERIFARAPD